LETVENHALLFLRRIEVILISRFGILLDPASSTKCDLKYYSSCLGLPSISTILSKESFETVAVTGLLEQWADQFQHYTVAQGSLAPIILQPTEPFKLFVLPERFEDLYEMAFSRDCSKCGEPPRIPAACLICGDFLNGCCVPFDRHSCSGDASIFISIKVSYPSFFYYQVCAVVARYHDSMHHINPPYLDKYGEVDLGLRHSRPLLLNKDRYDMIRKSILRHEIPSLIARASFLTVERTEENEFLFDDSDSDGDYSDDESEEDGEPLHPMFEARFGVRDMQDLVAAIAAGDDDTITDEGMWEDESDDEL
jgi:E3 ubiquitin-protein ligase UBR1